MSNNKIIRLVAELITGTQVSRSMGGHILGAGTKPWDQLHTELGMNGWHSVKEVEARLRRYITEKTK